MVDVQEGGEAWVGQAFNAQKRFCCKGGTGTSRAATSDDESCRLGDGGGLEQVLQRAVEVEGASEEDVGFADGYCVGDVAWGERRS